MKLDDIKKENIHKVPDGYFEELPQIIQSKVAHQPATTHRLFAASLQYAALPVLLLLAVAVYWVVYTPVKPSPSAEELLAQVSTDELIDYLDQSDITADEIMENIDLNSLDDIEFENTDTNLLDDADIDESDLDSYLDDFDIINDTL